MREKWTQTIFSSKLNFFKIMDIFNKKNRKCCRIKNFKATFAVYSSKNGKFFKICMKKKIFSINYKCH